MHYLNTNYDKFVKIVETFFKNELHDNGFLSHPAQYT